MAYVYRHIRLDKNEPFYIGISAIKESNYERAFSLNRNKHWLSIYNKTPIEVEILFDNVSHTDAKLKEIEFIDLYKRQIDGGTLINLTLGGDGVCGFKNPKLSERNKSGIWTGKKHTNESRLKISLGNIGKVVSEEQRKRHSKIAKTWVADLNPNYRGDIQAYKNGVLIGQYSGVTDAAKKLNCTPSRISSVVLGKEEFTKGYNFKRIYKGKIL